MTREPPRSVLVSDILGNAEVRKYAGRFIRANRKTTRGPVTRHVLLRWRRNHAFPEPLKKLDAGEIWSRRDVREWLKTYVAQQRDD